MFYVFILTKEGRGFSDKGIQYIINVVKQIYPVQTEEINIKMGKFYNNTEFLISELEKAENPVICISTPNNLDFVYADNITLFLENIKEDKDTNPWETAVEMLTPPED